MVVGGRGSLPNHKEEGWATALWGPVSWMEGGKAQFLCDLEQVPSPLWASPATSPFSQGRSQSC